MYGGGGRHNPNLPPHRQEHPPPEAPPFYDAFGYVPPNHQSPPVALPTAATFGAAAATYESWTSSLPEDDDPILQQRLQQVVEQHRPSSRNVLRELADVAEQQTTTAVASLKRKAYEMASSEEDDAIEGDDDDDDDDEDEEEENDEEDGKPTANKQRKLTASHARKQMTDIMEKQRWIRRSIRSAETQIVTLQAQVETQRSQLTTIDAQIQETASKLLEELLEDHSTWNQMFAHLVSFFNQHGHLKVPWRKADKLRDPVFARLGPWLVQQRKDYRRPEDDPDRLEPYKILALERLGIQWEPFREHWMNRYEDLKRFKEEHGHCRVPYCSHKKPPKRRDADTGEELEEDNPKLKYDSLGVWVKRQRNQAKNFKAGNKVKCGDMTEERIQLLEALGFEFESRPHQQPEKFITCYEELKLFKEKHGHSRVEEKDDKKLYDWIRQMRLFVSKYREGNEDNLLTQEQYQLLKAINLDASLRESKFEARFSELTEFKKLHGHCLVPASYPANPKLANWVQTQKRQFKLLREGKKSQMTEEKAKTLSDAGFEFEVTKKRKHAVMKNMDRSWEEYYAELKKYGEKYGQIAQIQQRKMQRLREWCDEQRVQHARLRWGKESRITEEQIQKLTELGFSWHSVETPSNGWDAVFGDLLVFSVKNGGSFDVNRVDLVEWIAVQRAEYKKFAAGVPSLLTSDQIQKLNEVGFPWTTDSNLVTARVSPPKSWEEQFGNLLAFKLKYGHFNVPESMKELHKWTCARRKDKAEFDRQKRSRRRSAVCEERMEKLTSVGFNWDGQQTPWAGTYLLAQQQQQRYATAWPNATRTTTPVTVLPRPIMESATALTRLDIPSDLAKAAAEIVANTRNKLDVAITPAAASTESTSGHYAGEGTIANSTEIDNEDIDEGVEATENIADDTAVR